MTQHKFGETREGSLPNFLLIGGQRAGSRALRDPLSMHDQIHMPRIGEIAPAYLSYPGCAEKIKAALGDIPLIVILRDPVSHMYSQYWHGVKYGHETLSFRDALAAEPERHMQLGILFQRHFDYLSTSAYATHITKFCSQFFRIHVCKLEDLARDTLKTLNSVYEFLEVANVSDMAERQASKQSKVARFQSINRFLNRIENRFGANRLTGFVRRKNFYPFMYPKLSDSNLQSNVFMTFALIR